MSCHVTKFCFPCGLALRLVDLLKGWTQNLPKYKMLWSNVNVSNLTITFEMQAYDPFKFHPRYLQDEAWGHFKFVWAGQRTWKLVRSEQTSDHGTLATEQMRACWLMEGRAIDSMPVYWDGVDPFRVWLTGTQSGWQTQRDSDSGPS